MSIYTKTRKILCENSYGYRLEFSYSFPYFLNSYSGIHEYTGDVATIKSAFGVGVGYVDTSVNSREIDLEIVFKDDENMQKRRNNMINIFPLKDNGTLYFYEGDIIRKIKYYVEKVTPVRKDGLWYYTVNLICPNPYFMDEHETTITRNNINKLLSFPLEIPVSGIEFGRRNENKTLIIVNNSHINCGLTITLTATDEVVNPIISNETKNEQMKINYTMKKNERIIISTYLDDKNIKLIDENGNEKNINNSFVFGSRFLQARNGTNRFRVSADNNGSKLEFSITYSNYYEAI